MMRMMMAVLALIVAAPAAAQTGDLPDWITGYWCFERGETKACVRYDPPEDGQIRATNIRFDNGVASEGTTSITRVENGVLVKRGSNGSILREVAHGPNWLEMDVLNPVPGQARRVRYSVEGDVLTLVFTVDGEAPSTQYYKREPEG